MVVKVGINGFGHIGQSILLASLKNSDIQVVAINDPFKGLDLMVDKLDCNSTRDRHKLQLNHDRIQFCIEGQTITVFSERDPTAIPWASHGVDYLVETIGAFTTPDKTSAAHLRFRTTSTLLADSSLFVFSVNKGCCKSDNKIMLDASYQTSKPDGDTLGVMENMMAAIPATTIVMNAIDDRSGKDRRPNHGVAADINYASLCETKYTPNTIPRLSDMLTDSLLRISNPDPSAIHLATSLEKTISYHDIKSVIEEGDPHYTISHSQHKILAPDFVDYLHSSIFDSKISISLVPQFTKTKRWHDSAYSGHSTRLADLIPQAA